MISSYQAYKKNDRGAIRINAYVIFGKFFIRLKNENIGRQVTFVFK